MNATAAPGKATASRLLTFVVLAGISMAALKPFAAVIGVIATLTLLYILPRRPFTAAVRQVVMVVLTGAILTAQVVEVIVDRRHEIAEKKAASGQQRAAQEAIQRDAQTFRMMTATEHLSAAKAILDQADDSETVIALRHLDAIPSDSSFAAEQIRVRSAFTRKEHLSKARQLIASARASSLQQMSENLKQANDHLHEVLAVSTEDKEALSLLNEATATAQQAIQKDNVRIQHESQEHPQPMEAASACESAVEKTLKAPSTANFPSFDEASISDLGNWHYVVSSHVDAQNSFGAKIRTFYRCDMQCVGIGRCIAGEIKFWDRQ